MNETNKTNSELGFLDEIQKILEVSITGIFVWTFLKTPRAVWKFIWEFSRAVWEFTCAHFAEFSRFVYKTTKIILLSILLMLIVVWPFIVRAVLKPHSSNWMWIGVVWLLIVSFPGVIYGWKHQHSKFFHPIRYWRERKARKSNESI